MVVWDSQVKDGYKRSHAPASDESASKDTLSRAAPVAWDGKKTSGVVEELLKNATDKAYGANSETPMLSKAEPFIPQNIDLIIFRQDAS